MSYLSFNEIEAGEFSPSEIAYLTVLLGRIESTSLSIARLDSAFNKTGYLSERTGVTLGSLCEYLNNLATTIKEEVTP